MNPLHARATLALACLSLVGLLAGCGSSGGSGTSGSGLGAIATPRIEGDIQVFAVTGTSSLHFSPSTLEAKPGEIRVDFSVEQGSAPHDFVIDAIPGARTELVSAGEKASTTFTVTNPGTYQFDCTVHSNMQGTLKVG